MDKLIKVSKNPNKNWRNNLIQFARLIAEAEGAGCGIVPTKELCETMDLTPEQINEIVDRAQDTWHQIKELTKSGVTE
jgi:hypothetical protein